MKPGRLYLFFRLLIPALLCGIIRAVPASAYDATSDRPVAVRENIALLDSVARHYADTLAHDVATRSFTDFRILISQHPAAERLRQHIMSRTNSSVAINQPTSHIDNALTVLDLYIADYAIRYALHETSTDSLVRDAHLAVNTTLTTPGGTSLPFPDYDITLRDTIARTDIPFIESRQYLYGQAPIPDRPSGFYSDIVEPLIIVSSALITVLLLFTVRSQ
jgi:hypothetical protein